MKEGIRIWWCGWASNPVGGVRHSLIGSTPVAFRPARVPGRSDICGGNHKTSVWKLIGLINGARSYIFLHFRFWNPS
jgi:hypothetical protein